MSTGGTPTLGHQEYARPGSYSAGASASPSDGESAASPQQQPSADPSLSSQQQSASPQQHPLPRPQQQASPRHMGQKRSTSFTTTAPRTKPRIPAARGPHLELFNRCSFVGSTSMRRAGDNAASLPAAERVLPPLRPAGGPLSRLAGRGRGVRASAVPRLAGRGRGVRASAVPRPREGDPAPTPPPGRPRAPGRPPWWAPTPPAGRGAPHLRVR